MKEITSYKETSENSNGTSVKDFIKIPCAEKNKVLAYFERYAEFYTILTCPATDFITGEIMNESIKCFEDGEYCWTNQEVYLFKKYDLKLNDDFIEYVLNRS